MTTRHSETASEATTASISRGEATGVCWPLKPAADARDMVGDPSSRKANHPRHEKTRKRHRQYYGSFSADSPQVLRLVNDLGSGFLDRDQLYPLILRSGRSPVSKDVAPIGLSWFETALRASSP